MPLFDCLYRPGKGSRYVAPKQNPLQMELDDLRAQMETSERDHQRQSDMLKQALHLEVGMGIMLSYSCCTWLQACKYGGVGGGQVLLLLCWKLPGCVPKPPCLGCFL